MKKLIFLLLNIFFLLTQNFIFPQEKVVFITDSLISNNTFYPTVQLSFQAGDDSSWADPNFDHSNWKITDTRFLADGPDVEWNGTGWFRMNIFVDSNLVNKHIGIFLYNTGYLKLYLNGNLLHETKIMNRFPQQIVFNKPGKNLIAIRFSNSDWEFLNSNGRWAGFRIGFADYDKAVDQAIHSDRFKLIEELIFLIPALILAFLHFFIFLFDKRTKQNLYYVIFLLSFSFFIFITYSWYFASYQTTIVLLSRFGPLALNFILLFGAFTIFAIFDYKHKYAKIFLLIAIVLGIIGFITAGHKYVYYLSFIFISFVSYQAGQVVFSPNKKLGEDKKIIQIGFFIFSLSGIYQMLLSFKIVWPILGSNSIFLFGVLAFLLSMSISLAKEFVKTRKDLEQQLIQVKELSQKTLEQELSAKELATEKKILEIENERKSKELEEARHLQLSLLPNDIPILDDLEISVYFTTATEVGGDYYDFLQTKDGTLIIALGDATGHGTKAGLMVAIIKGLFKSLAEKSNIPEFFSKSTEIIKDMKLGNLFMSLLLLRIKNKTVTASAAGMPPILVYRSKEKMVESIVCKGMPIGAYKDFPYETNEFKVETGDVILILSDGLPELFNDKKEMFDYNRVNLKLSELGAFGSKEIVNGFKDSINEWRKNKLPDDDITLLAIKFK